MCSDAYRVLICTPRRKFTTVSVNEINEWRVEVLRMTGLIEGRLPNI